MAIETLAELVKMLADELQRSGTEPREFAEISGVEEDRLELMQTEAWGDLTLVEITAISEALKVDFSQALFIAGSRAG
ncbi:hypothetical protein N181_28055 [Sinorhizobium fredii USDA 205]|uniref:HTH cro/C1-type domain-containing protein n=1 Tax=Rhizobium fredii TaxID=380 RepID=A0A844A5J1_RHIFR|nr:hypothetical protein [Sinorhizobium fredii]KSV81674.1 hypothetical protein N181_28055 [Sinorhizobium fredii USDA 205]MQX06810.1 hypothetical protein [Sinorhizobium fredii]GEC35514.1 hypothetical protein EFR01_56850 [Sinorhizobium fredii]GLS08242.1 hypothetical protein GCM10007864_18710 [Sinorhizobium fredii]